MIRLFALLLSSARAWHCHLHGEPEPKVDDYCNGSVSDGGCHKYSELGHDGSHEAWLATREALRAEIFGLGGQLPGRYVPDVGPEPVEDPWFFGNCRCAQAGQCNASDCAKRINLTRFEWHTTIQVNSSSNITLKSVVFHSLNTSGLAPSNLMMWPPLTWPEVSMPPLRRSDTLVIYHDGHTVTKGCLADTDGTVDWLNQLGYDVMFLQMPRHGCNAKDPLKHASHDFSGLDAAGKHWMRFFIEPVVLTINYAKSLGYKYFAMAGLSGGGWTTTVAPAVDPRITLSIPIAGSLPCEFRHTSWDYEQFCDQKWSRIANYSSLYVLAALEQDRSAVQIIHEWDDCCFHACGRHERISSYNSWVRSQMRGNFVTSATEGNVHEVNPRDKIIMGMMLEKWRKGTLSARDFEQMPFSLTPWPPQLEQLLV
eukprot:TRINITY_DN30303_c0_g1_i1.p1 TRINITY_DN30303_c0_g1~~TRINITY_DN30303_c0_g1_i1.p1  ORF type:complete len:439 (+),score=39.07 TRINITY_DN30303_c0_g1_i1:45-1319(+)